MTRLFSAPGYDAQSAAAGYAAARQAAAPAWTPSLDAAVAETNARLYKTDTRPAEDAGEVAVIFGHSADGTLKESVMLPASAREIESEQLAAVIGARIRDLSAPSGGDAARFPIVFLAQTVAALGGRAAFERAVERAAGARAGDGFALVFSPTA